MTFGYGGNVAGSEAKKGFGYYETIAGGSGAGPSWDGTNGVHVHMTNTRITDAEVFERRYPVILREFGLRKGSAGHGQHVGGEGVVRDIEFRIPVQCSILSERRVFRPYGLEGGGDAEVGVNYWVRKTKKVEGSDAEAGTAGDDKDSGKEGEDVQYVNLGGKNTVSMQVGDRIIIMTPGGGGWGKEGEDSKVQKNQDPKHSWKGGSIAGRQAEAEASA